MRRPVIICVLVLELALAVASVVGVYALTVPQPDPSDIVWGLSWLGFPIMGAFVAWHRPDNVLGWLFLAIGGAIYTATATSGFAELLLPEQPGWAGFLGWLSQVCFGLAWFLAANVMLLLYPDGRPGPGIWAWALRLTWAVIGAWIVAMTLQAGPTVEGAETVNPFGVPALGDIPAQVANGVFWVSTAVTLLALIGLVVRWRASDGADRRRLAWFAMAAIGVLGAVILGVTVGRFDGSTPWTGVIVESLGLILFPVALGIAILRERLLDIEYLLSRTLTYGLLAGGGFVAYLLVVLAATRWGEENGSTTTALIIAVIVVVCTLPLRDSVQRRLRRGLFGQSAEPYRVMATVGETLGTVGAAQATADSVAQLMRLPGVRVVLDPAPVTDAATQEPGVEILPLTAGGVNEGALVVSLRRGQTGFSDDERRLLLDIAQQIAFAVQAERLSAELQESRQSIVRAREDERQRLRRELHDGIGPTLAAVGLRLDALADSTTDEGAGALLAAAQRDLRGGVGELRRVVDGLRPPSLDEVGLVGVLRERAAALRESGMHVEVEAPEWLDVPPAVEVAAYRTVSEALTNISRHAGATAVTVRLTTCDDHLDIEVTDNGVGGTAPRDGGLGLGSMAARAEELGGTFTISSLPGCGTQLRSVLPLGVRP